MAEMGSKKPAPKPPLVSSSSDDLAAQLRSEKAGALVMAARSAHRRGNKTEAKELLRQAFQIDPNDSGGLELLGDFYLEEGEQEKALKIFERGLRYHPKHHAFEEKIGICHVDLAEMRRHRERREQIMAQGGLEPWLVISLPRAFGLSAVLPGAGQVYIGQSTRGLTLFLLALGAFLGWAIPLYYAIKNVSAQPTRGARIGLEQALSTLSAPALMWFWLMVAGWVAVHIYAAVDAATQAKEINDLRQQGWEVLED